MHVKLQRSVRATLTDQVLLVQVTMFVRVVNLLLEYAALIRLKYSEPHTYRPFEVPGGKIGAWLIALPTLILSGMLTHSLSLLSLILSHFLSTVCVNGIARCFGCRRRLAAMDDSWRRQRSDHFGVWLAMAREPPSPTMLRRRSSPPPSRRRSRQLTHTLTHTLTCAFIFFFCFYLLLSVIKQDTTTKTENNVQFYFILF